MGKRAKGGQGAEAESDVVMSMWNPLSPSAGKPAASPARSPKKERKGGARKARSGGGGPLSASSAQAEPEGGSSGQGVGGFQVSNPLIKSREGGGPAPSVVSAAE